MKDMESRLESLVDETQSSRRFVVAPDEAECQRKLELAGSNAVAIMTGVPRCKEWE
jgi:hypothetical protein